MKRFFLLLLLSCFAHSQELTIGKEAVAELLFKEQIIGRDSGLETNVEFLSGCLKRQSDTQYVLECDDVLFKHYVSIFPSGDDFVVLITEDGASVENHWIYSWRSNNPSLTIENVWPHISDDVISGLLTAATGNDKYTTKYVKSVAHSSYRTVHGEDNILTVASGIPDESYGLKLGTIKWTGSEFVFVAK